MAINIEKHGRRIVVRTDEPLTGFRTAIPGAYQTVAGYWTVPLSLESCKLLRERFGRRLVVGKELSRWAKTVRTNREYMADLAKQKDARLERLPKVAPRLYKAMRTRRYQRVGARFVADNPATLVADDPGLGKTLIALGGILESGIPGPYLVSAPKTAARSVWEREIIRWLPREHRAITLPELRHQREMVIRLTRYGPMTWLIVHPEILLMQEWWVCQQPVIKRKRNRKTGKRFRVIEPCNTQTPAGSGQKIQLLCGHRKTPKTKKVHEAAYPKLFEIEWGAIVVDESHESLIRRTSSKPTQRRRGMESLRLRPGGLRIAMSGTPCDSKPHQLWGTLNWLAPVQYSAFHRWAALYWQTGGYTGFEIGEFRQDREKLLWDSLSAIALRRTKAEVAQDLPPKMLMGSPLVPSDPDSVVGVWLEMEGKQAKAYESMERLSVAELESGRLEATTALAELTRLKQLACSYGDIEEVHRRVRCPTPKEHRCSGWHKELAQKYRPALPSNKFNWLIENLEEWGYPQHPITKVVVVSFFTGILEEFRAGVERHFRTKPKRPLCTAITGRTPVAERANIINAFNDYGHNTPQVMFLNVKAGGTAITLDTADRMIFLSETRIPDQQKQAEDRIHRVSRPRQCMYYYLRSLGTVDVGTAIVNREADRATHRLLDTRRGIEYMRYVLAQSH